MWRGKNKGSLSIEAIIAFTIYVSFMFLLLSVVKLSLTKVVLTSATSETAKQIATASYPLSFLIAYENDMDATALSWQGTMKLSESINGAVADTAMNILFPGGGSAGASLDSGLGEIGGSFISKGEELLWTDVARPALEKLERETAPILAGKIFNEYVESSSININKDDLDLTIVKLPQSDYAYAQTASAPNYAEIGLVSGENGNYGALDVVIASEYKYKFVLPFLPSIDVTLRQVAVERGWLFGGNGVVTSPDEGFDFSSIVDEIFGADKVYVSTGMYGQCYHKDKNCMALKRWPGTAFPMSKTAAVKNGMQPCKICYKE